MNDLHTDAESYVAHWATLTGRSPREIYIPESLRGTGPDDSDATESGNEDA